MNYYNKKRFQKKVKGIFIVLMQVTMVEKLNIIKTLELALNEK